MSIAHPLRQSCFRFATLGILALATSVGNRASAEPAPTAVNETSREMWGTSARSENTDRGQWLKDSRFAMFIHWGLYSELGGQWNGQNYYGIAEWIMNRAQIPAAKYAKVAERFNPTDFNAAEWVQLAKAAGMRHIMITSKHHEGFAMFKSAASDFNIVDATPFGRDPLKELAEACRAEGLRLGFYYSQSADWHEPNAVGNTWDFPKQNGDFQRYLNSKAVPQIEELLRGYGPVAGLWFDTPGPIKPAQSKQLVDLVHKLQPRCLVNTRIGNNLGDYDTLGDQEIPRLPRAGLWESIDTHNDTWGYSSLDHNWKGPREIAERLVRVVSRGGTYMLNVGPDGRGRIPEASVQMLRKVGEWVHANQDAIHGAGPTPFSQLPWGECTCRDDVLYLHVFQWPKHRQLIVPGLSSKVKSVRLRPASELIFETNEAGLVITLPEQEPDSLIPVIEVELIDGLRAVQDQFVLNGYRQTLEAAAAAVKNCAPTNVSWMEKFGDWKHAECLSGWRGDTSCATWSFRTVEPGTFYLDIEYTCTEASDYSEWRVRCADSESTFPLIDTGEREKRKQFGGPLPRFRTYRVGIIDLPSKGAHHLTIGPTGNEVSGVRISSLILTPAR